MQLCTHHLNRNQTEDLQVSATTTPAIPPTFNISIIPSGQPTIPQKQPATPIVKYLLSIRYAGFPKPDIHASGRRQDRSSCDARIILPLEASSSGKGYTIYPASYKPTCAIASPSSAQMLALYQGIQHPFPSTLLLFDQPNHFIGNLCFGSITSFLRHERFRH